MEAKKTRKHHSHRHLKSVDHSAHAAQVSEAASHLVDESKKMVNGLYKDGKNKMNEVQDKFKNYSDEVIQKIQEKPLKALLVAGGIGFLLSALFRRK